MSYSDFISGKLSAGGEWERKLARQELLRAEYEQHEAFLGALRAFGADLPSGKELFERWIVNREGEKPR
jgi:hypothetical protein